MTGFVVGKRGVEEVRANRIASQAWGMHTHSHPHANTMLFCDSRILAPSYNILEKKCVPQLSRRVTASQG
jgi:hypothetical protein